MNVCGYLIEREFRTALSPSGWDPVVTPVAAAGFTLALVMAGLGLPGRRRQPDSAGSR